MQLTIRKMDTGRIRLYAGLTEKDFFDIGKYETVDDAFAAALNILKGQEATRIHLSTKFDPVSGPHLHEKEEPCSPSSNSSY